MRISKFKYNVGDIFKDNNRDIKIVERTKIKGLYKSKPNEITKNYRCKCNRCESEDAWINEAHLKEGRGCPVCHSKRISIGVNDIPTTAPWMIPYFQGGYDEAKLYTKYSNKKIFPRCPDCGEVSNRSLKIGDIYTRHSIRCSCSDGVSFPEKFMMSVLKQLNIEFKPQLTKTTFSWCDKFKYDFYISSVDCIIETHGEQHYKDCSWGDYETIHINDKKKKSVAKQNNIKNYVTLDCRKSELKWIKKSIMKSILPKLFNFTEDDVDWIKCEEDSYKNIVKEICNFKKDHAEMTATDITPYFNVDRSTIGKYLHKGEKLGWCTYNGCNKYVEVFKDGISLGKFRSAKELSSLSEKEFGVYLHPELIKRVCRKETEFYKGYYFEYTYDLDIR